MRVPATIAVVLAAAGCASSTVQSDARRDVDPATLTTYAWLENDHPDEGATALFGEGFGELVRQATDAALAAKGYRTDPNPAFLVNWHAVVQERIDTARMAEYYGYGPNWRTWASPTYPSAAMPVSTDRDEEGTLVIDLLQAADRELYWRGFLTRVIDRQAGIQDRRARVDAAVRAVLDQLPPAK